MATFRAGSHCKKWLIIAALLLFSRSFGRILRLPCQGVADFSIEEKGHLLQGSMIEEYEEVGLYECYEHCFYNQRCKSINIEVGDYGRCQLNNASSNDVMDRVNLTENANWNFRSTNFSDLLLGRNCKEKKPCRQDQYCMDTCECPGYECISCVGNNKGIHCNRCASNPCQGGGTCIETQHQMCICPSGLTGAFCETDIDECETNPSTCKNGMCVNFVNGYSCTCDDGYAGINCETEINECESNPCQNGASCTDMFNDYWCTCSNGYSGKNCETDINECSSSPCLNEGTCNDLVNSYSCTCKASFEGPNCKTESKQKCDFSTKTGKENKLTRNDCISHCKELEYTGASGKVHGDHYDCYCSNATSTTIESTELECIISI